MKYTYEQLAKMIDHSLLHPTMTDQELEEGCRVAAKFGVASVCIKPYAVKRAAELLRGTGVLVGAVIGFPHGNSCTESKRCETRLACEDGAAEIDMVINIGKALSGDWDYVETDIRAVCEEAHGHGAKVKVICGTVEGKQGPVGDIVIDPEYLDVTVPALSEFVHQTAHGHTVFAYVIRGKGVFCNEKNPFAYDALGTNYFDMDRDYYIHDGTAVLFGDGDQVTVTAQGEPVRFLLISGKPIGEPVAWYGPIVMNTEEELQIAFEEYQKGTFIKHKKTMHM